jgi:general secretion pathway protein G
MKKIALLFIGPALIIILIYTILIKGGSDTPSEKDINFARLLSVEKALVKYYKSCGSFPTKDQGLEALVSMPQLPPHCTEYPAKAFLENYNDINDAYGNPIQYDLIDGSVFLMSFGADAKKGGQGNNQDLELSIDI